MAIPTRRRTNRRFNRTTLFQRRTRIERLEDRALLASNFGSLPEFRNPMRQFDVNDDGRTSPVDALIIINELNQGGARVLGDGGIIGDDGGSGLAAAGLFSPYIDTNGDGRLTAADALLIINKLNAAQNEQVSIRVEVTDLDGNPIDVLSPGQDFQLRGFTKDLRTPEDPPNAPPENRTRGVFSVYFDVNYDTTRVDVDLAGRAIEYSELYENGRRPVAQITATDGLLDDIGALAGLSPHGSGEELVFIVPMTATGAGVASFSLDPEDSLLLEVAVFGAGEVPDNEILFIADQVTIGDQPSASIADLSQPEGNVQNNATLTVTLSSPAILPTTLEFATAADTGANPATAGSDFTAATGTVTFAVGETEKTINVPIIGDLLNEPDETFRVVLSSPVGVTIADAEAVVTIENDDALPEITINNVMIPEPTDGTANAIFQVSLSNPVNTPVTVEFATANGTAVEPSDFTSRTGVLTFAAGQTTATISVAVLADAEPEGAETFTVVLSNPTGGEFPDGAPTVTGTATIVDAAAAKIVMRLEARNAQGEIQTVFEPGDLIRIRAYLTDATASDPDDQDGVFQHFHDLVYNSALVDLTGAVVFGPEYQNQQSGDVSMDGLVDELGASAGLAPTGPVEVLFWEIAFTAAADGLAQFTTDPADILPLHESILFDPPEPVPPNEIQYGSIDVLIGSGPTISIGDAQAVEGNSGTTPMVFEVSLATPHIAPVTVSFATSNGTATAPADYQAATGQVTFAVGETTKTITVNVVGDTLLEPAETFFVTLSNPIGAEIAEGGGQGTGTILDDEVRTLSINDRVIAEGGFGVFTVALSSPAANPITVNFATADGTATANADYVPNAGTLTFNAGEQTKTITVQTLPDDVADDNETFTVQLSGATGANIARGAGTGTISELALVGLSGFVYVDSNGDGVKGAGEAGIAGVTIELIGVGLLPGGVRQQIQTFTLTDASGRYLFENLPTGSYSIHEVQPSFFNDGADRAGPGGFVSANDWLFVNFAEGGSAAGFNFGEAGLRLEFFGKKMFVASAMNNPNGVPIDVSGGDAFFAFDAGFSSINLQAVSNTAQGATITILDQKLNVLARTTAAKAASLSFVGTPQQPYFVRIGGGSSSLVVSSLVIGGPNASGQAADNMFASIDDWLN
jgi:hypothetical protein